MTNINADKIIWSGNTLDELRRLLGGEPTIEFFDFPTSGIDYPWPITVKQVIYTVTDQGPTVDIVLEFDEIPDASQYEVRNSLLPPLGDQVYTWDGTSTRLLDITAPMTDGSLSTSRDTQTGPLMTYVGTAIPKAVMMRGIDPNTITPGDAYGWKWTVTWTPNGIETGGYWYLNTSGRINDPNSWLPLGPAASSSSTGGPWPQEATLTILGLMSEPGPYSIYASAPDGTNNYLGMTPTYGGAVAPMSRPIVAFGLPPVPTSGIPALYYDPTRWFTIHEVLITHQSE